MRPYDDTNFLREVILSPYRRGMGPRFRLRTWDTYQTNGMGKSCVRYELAELTTGKSAALLFWGSDFYCSSCHAIDSDASVRALLSFLTLRPGDTDAEYFTSYTPEQMAYATLHAEALSSEVAHRFGE